MRLRLFGIACLAATSLCAAVAPAQTGSEWIISGMAGPVRVGATWPQVRTQMLTAFYRSNPDERGVSPEGIENMRRSATAHRRAQAISEIIIYDLNGDGIVTKDEITAAMQPRARQMFERNGVQLEPTPEQVRVQLDALVSSALRWDLDGDGIISADEIAQHAQQQAQATDAGWQANTRQFVPMTLDTNGDGAVSLIEYEAVVRAQFDLIDKDRNGIVSESEFGEFNQRLNEARQAIQRAQEAQLRKQRFEAAALGCEVPAPPAGARLILLGTGDAKALSDAWIGDQDKPTYVTTVDIAPGREPLHLALTSTAPMIWDLVGATERIVGVVAHSETSIEDTRNDSALRPIGAPRPSPTRPGAKPLVGVMGVAPDKVHFTAHKGCLVPVSPTTMKDGTAQAMAALSLGRAADEIGGEASATAFRVPVPMHLKGRPVRNAMALPKGGPGDLLWRQVENQAPAGIAHIDVESVVAAHPVKRYAVLPMQAGLAALVDAGALTITGVSRGVRLDTRDIRVTEWPEKFRIDQKIRMPARAGGTFVLPRDVPLPEGNLSSICLLTEADMRPVNGERRRCSDPPGR